MKRLSGLDAAFVYAETPTNHMHVGLVGVFDPATMAGGYSFAQLRELVQSRLPLVAPFRRRLREVPFRLQHPVWIEDGDFDLDYHLRRVSIPAPGDEGALASLAADVFGRGLDRRHPLWEMYVVEGLRGGLFGVVAKVHHAAIDGVSGAELIARLLDMDAAGAPPQLDDYGWEPEAVPTDLELVAGAGRELVSRIGPALQSVRRVIEAAEGRRRDGLATGPPFGWRWAPKTSLNVAISAHRRFATADISLDDVAVIRRSSGCATVNDVALAACAGALRRYVGSLPVEPLVALVPVSVRTEHSSNFGNKVSALLVSLPTNVSSPWQRLGRVVSATAAAKADRAVIDVETLTEWGDLLAPGAAAKAARVLTSTLVLERFGPVANVVISNVRGADVPLYLAGAKLVRLWPMGPVADGMALNITAMSYLGRLRFGLVACRETVPDLASLAGMIEAEVATLLRAASTRERRRQATGRSRLLT